MANRSVPRKLKKFSTFDNNGSASWSNLDQDLLLLIMMQVGVFDFIALSGVCKSWRSIALSNWNKFMVSKQPMHLYVSRCLTEKDCYLEDYKIRKLKTTIPHSNGRICVGLTCGYLIFYGRKTHDFWLVNPLTRKQLHFPGFPFALRPSRKDFRGILVFSPSMSGWVFVVLQSLFTEIYFSPAGNQASWRYIFSNSPLHDLHFFKGNIYTIDISNRLWELRLNPEPTLTLQDMRNCPWKTYSVLEFVSSDENLYVMDTIALGYRFVAFECDLNEMKWVNSERTIGEYAVFLSEMKCDAAIKPNTWAYPWAQYERVNYSQDKKGMMCSTKKMWYFPHHCLNDNDFDMENGALLNILKE